MTPYDDAAETHFGTKIHAKFPYNRPEQATALIQESRSISANAVFYVLDEICRSPTRGVVTQERQRELIEEWATGFDHPLKKRVLYCAERLISGRFLTLMEAVAAIDEVGSFDGQRAALSIAYFSGDATSKDGDAALTAAENRVRASWDERGV
jgi:hypothetical protein